MLYLIALIISTLASFTVHAKYQSQLELEFKYGNHRILGQGNILMSLWQQPNQLLFTHIIGLLDKDRNHEGNLGLGYRYQKYGYILGTYGYYDHRYSTHHHHFHQITLGLEYLTSYFEARLNGYWPFHDKQPLKGQVLSFPQFIGAHYQLVKLNHQEFEYALGGLDMEFGLKLLKAPIYLYAGYYHFKHQGFSHLYGPRIRTRIHIAPMLSLSAECHYDRPRGLNYFLGLRLKTNLGSKYSFSRLARKMTQPPLRDIDVIIQVGKQIIEIDTQAAIPVESYVDLDKIRENLSGHYMVTKDIVTVGQRHIPIGNRKTPFTGIIIGVSDDKSQFQLRKIRGLVLEDNKGDIGLFGYVDHACIGYLLISHQTLSFTKDSTVGSLVGRAGDHNVLIHNMNLSSLLTAHSFLGGLVGCARRHNRFIHNTNYGTLIAEGSNNYIGGIVGLSCTDNIWAHNLNVGTITLHPMELSASFIVNYAGGIVSSTGRYDILTYNTNAGKIQSIGDKESHIGGIVACMRDRSICIHNVNVAFLKGNKLGGIGSEAGKQNTISYNFNAGSLMGSHSGSCMGGILVESIKNNIISYNANSGNIAGEDPQIGGIVTSVCKDNIIAYNVNIGKLSAYKKGIYNIMGGITAGLKTCNTLHQNINTGAIFIDPGDEAVLMLRSLKIKRSNRIGGIVAWLKKSFYNNITDNMNTGIIAASKKLTENHIGGIIGELRDFSNNYFADNIYSSSALISHTPTMEQQLQNNPKVNLGSSNPFINITDFSALPSWHFGLNRDWLLTVRGPMLTWLLKDRALQLLQYFNYLKLIHADDYLPLEMMLAIADALDDFSYLSMAHIQSIYHYAFTSRHSLVYHLSQPKCHWSKDDYLAYVLNRPR